MVEHKRGWRLQLLISSFTYENFLAFRQEFLAPYMNLPFVEEDYDKEIWDELMTSWGAIHEISRGHGKSEIGIQLTVFMALCQPNNDLYQGQFGMRHAMKELLIISSDMTTVSELRDRILGYFLADDNLREYIPEGTSKRDQNAKYNTTKVNLTNGTIMHFRPIKTKRGLHVDFIWIDDPTTESSTLTDRQTEDFVKGAIMPMGTAKHALFWVTGTPIRTTDILSNLSKTGAYLHKKRPALNEEGVPLSKRFTKEMLLDIKKKIGSVKFSAEYLLNPVDDSVSLIKQSWLDSCKDKRMTLTKNRGHYDTVVCGVDFSFGDTEYSRGGGDNFVLWVWGIEGDKKVLLNVYWRNDLSATEQLRFVKEIHQIYCFDHVGMEFNSIRALATELDGLRLPLKLFNMGNVDEKDKKKPDFSRVISLSKRNMIGRIGTQAENKLMVLPYGDEESKTLVDKFCSEATSWALEEGKIIELGIHPDLPIAAGIGLECASQATFVISW